MEDYRAAVVPLWLGLHKVSLKDEVLGLLLTDFLGGGAQVALASFAVLGLFTHSL